MEGSRVPSSVPRVLSAALIVVILGLSLAAALSSSSGAESLGNWSVTNPYAGGSGVAISGESCATSLGYIYCVGGTLNGGYYTSAVYYAKVDSGGASAWKETTDYGSPSTSDNSGNYGYPTAEGSCAISTGYIYCVGGTGPSGLTDAVFYAPVSSAGVGAWSITTNYPVTVMSQSCMVAAGYIYCVGGYTGTGTTSTVYYAQATPSGMGAWKETTDYGAASKSYKSGAAGVQTSEMPCAVSGGYIYCVGGYTTSGYTDAVFYAKVDSTGVGAWAATTSYALGDVYGESCVASSGYVYCVAGISGSSYKDAVYYAKTDSTGVIGGWVLSSSYPLKVQELSCAVYSGYIYCAGGDNSGTPVSNVYYVAITSPATVTTASTTVSTSVTTTTLTQPTTTTSVSTSVTTTTLTTGTTTVTGPTSTVTVTVTGPTTTTSTGAFTTTRTQTLPTSGSILVSVYGAGGLPEAGTAVILSGPTGQTQVTDPNGEASFADLPFSQYYTVSATVNGTVLSAPVSLGATHSHASVVLQPTPARNPMELVEGISLFLILFGLAAAIFPMAYLMAGIRR